jgi:N-carbamoylputrescine amidase
VKIGLVAAKCINNDISFNTSQMIKYLEIASRDNIDYIFFGESFLQGFDSLRWSFDVDKDIAIKRVSIIIDELKNKAKKYSVGLGFGYFELSKASIYSSYLILSPQGMELVNYRRLSRGWKEFTKTDNHYKEGSSIKHFKIGTFDCTLALCGDLWDEETLQKFKNNKVYNTNIVWPVHVDFTIEAWSREITQYHEQALKFSKQTFLINNIVEPSAHGGAFYFTKSGYKSVDFDKEEMLIVRI